MYQQLIEPNLNVVGESGECLVYVRDVFGIGPKYPDAAVGWNDAEYKFPDEQPPVDVTVPVWFSWDGPINGHVAVSVNGSKFYSVSAQGDKVFDSLQELMDFIGGGIAYLGWSEDVDGVRVVQPESNPEVSIKINPGTWNVRTGPGTNYSVIPAGPAEGGQQYGAVIQSNGWAQITFTDKTGYVGPAAFTVL